jgi:hypothetical protein
MDGKSILDLTSHKVVMNLCKARNEESQTTVSLTIRRKGIDRVIPIDDETCLGIITGQISVDDLEIEESQKKRPIKSG